MTDEPTIKPCPKCGSMHIQCRDCKHHVLLGDNGDVDYDEWNIKDPYRQLSESKADNAKLTARVKELEGKLERIKAACAPILVCMHNYNSINSDLPDHIVIDGIMGLYLGDIRAISQAIESEGA